MMPAAVAPHSHRPTTRISHKPFKSKAASKHELRDRAKGRVPKEDGASRKTPRQQVMSKLDRRNQAKQVRLSKLKQNVKENSVFSGRDGAPRIVAVVPLCADGDAKAAIRKLNDSLDIDLPVQDGNFRLNVDRFRQRIQYVPLERDFASCLDATRLADFVLILLSANEEVDSLGELILRSIEGQGLSTLFTAVQGLDNVEPAKQKQAVLGSLKSFITHFHPDQGKIYSLDSRQECSNLMRSLCTMTPKGVRWRDERSWMLAEDARFSESDHGTAIITGVIRGRPLKADRLIQVGDWGTFQIQKITEAPILGNKDGGQSSSVDVDSAKVLDEPTDDRDGLDDFAPQDVVMDDGDSFSAAALPPKKGVLLDEHHYFSDDDAIQSQNHKKRVPRGTSDYQSAWYLDDVSDSGSDMEDIEMRDKREADDYEEDYVSSQESVEDHSEPESAGGSFSESLRKSQMAEDNIDDGNDSAHLASFRSRGRDDVNDDKEFPDEIELRPDELARERLARYRGLKSLRTSPWFEDEDRAHEPKEWRRLLQMNDYRASRSSWTREALAGGVAVGTRVHVYVKGLTASANNWRPPNAPITLFSLLRHENKRTALNYIFHLSNDNGESIKSKEEIIAQCGPRRMVIRPIFSQSGSTPNDVHKYCRYLHPGQSAIATFIGPITWGSVPVMFFKRTVTGTEVADSVAPSIGLSLIGTGTNLPPSTSRVVAKRVVLTGHPYQIHKNIVTVRYMFFNRQDVEWFKALPLWTRRGKGGYIKEPLGTHGHYKATFDGRINPQDAVAVSLYKRIWPRNSTPFQGRLLDSEDVSSQKAGDDLMTA